MQRRSGTGSPAARSPTNWKTVVPHHSDDIIDGGMGNDWLHGSGDDASAVAEALPEFY